jgi:2,3-bisphosphoglycerate-independent phosphoglycerate mutase
MNSKFAILVGDGMADLPIPELDNKTPLEYAATPNMDFLAQSGNVGLVSTVPEGFPPGSDVANLSLLGYDPALYYSGRAPVEAASLGIKLASEDTAFRCNLVTIIDGIMVDYSAGHIDTDEASVLITELQKVLGSHEIQFHSGTSYRHILVIKNFPEGLKCTPPHDITDRTIAAYIPQGQGEIQIQEIMSKARSLLQRVNPIEKRSVNGKNHATDIWLWGQGKSLKLPNMCDRFGITGSVISAVDLIRGLGVLAGLHVRVVEGATGYLGTNYSGKVAAALDAFNSENFVYLHVEAPDETSHEGNLQKKIQAIEEFDTFVVGEMLAYQKQHNELRILVAPDHATPVSTKTHSASPVPFAVCGPGITPGNCNTYSEKAAQDKTILTGPQLFEHFLRGF